MPPGDSPYRLAIIDALTMGCIPVAFHRAQTEQLWQLQWATWAHSATLTLDYAAVINGSLDVLDYLRKLPPPLVSEMQRSVRANFHRLTYGMVTGTTPNAPLPAQDHHHRDQRRQHTMHGAEAAGAKQDPCDLRTPRHREDALEVLLRSAARHASDHQRGRVHGAPL